MYHFRYTNALELFLLGRKLTKLGEEAIPQPRVNQIPLRARAILFDVFEHPGTTISNIVTRTGTYIEPGLRLCGTLL